MQFLIVLSALVAVACGQAIVVKGPNAIIAGPSGTIETRGGVIADNKGAWGRSLIAPTILSRSLVAPTLLDRSAFIGSPLIARSTLGFDTGFIGDYGLGLGLNRGLYY